MPGQAESPRADLHGGSLLELSGVPLVSGIPEVTAGPSLLADPTEWARALFSGMGRASAPVAAAGAIAGARGARPLSMAGLHAALVPAVSRRVEVEAAAALSLDELRTRLGRVEVAVACPLSMATMVEPWRLPCGHIFDRPQIMRAFAVSSRCPCCRSTTGRIAFHADTSPAPAEIGEMARDFRRALPAGIAAADAATLRRAGTALAAYLAPDWQPPASWVPPLPR